MQPRRANGKARHRRMSWLRWFERKLPVEAMGLEPTNLLTASQALYQLSYAPRDEATGYQPDLDRQGGP